MRTTHCLIAFCLAFTASGLAQSPDAIIQRENIRRQEIVIRSTQQLNQASALIREGKIEEGEKIIRNILATVPDSGDGKPVHTKASNILGDIEIKRGQDAAATGDWFTSKAFGLKALDILPGDARAKALIATANSNLGIGPDGDVNPAVDKKLINDLNEINKLLANARDYEGTGQLAQASQALQDVLQIDPHNKQAARHLKKIEQKRKYALELDRDVVREELVTQTSANWTNQLNSDHDLDTTTIVVEPIQKSNEFAIQKKLKTIIIPEVEFSDATVEDAARFLTAKTRELDENGNGISFLIKDKSIIEDSQPFSLSLKQVPASEVLRYITNLAGVKSKIEEFAVFIVPLSVNDEVLVSREFAVRASFFDVEPAGGAGAANPDDRRRRGTTRTGGSASKDEIRAALEARGVIFNEGATAIYNNATGILSAKNTQDQIDLIEELVIGNQGETLMVRVETKFIEINQTDLEELTPQFNLEGTYAVFPTTGINGGLAGGSASFTNGMRGATNLRPVDGVNRILNQGTASTPINAASTANSVGITGAIDGNRFATLVNLISQKQSSDVMTAPSLIINDGTKGTITVAREFSYPIEFDPAESQTGADIGPGAGNNGIQTVVVPAFGSEFETKNIGVNMEVEPRISVDRKRVLVRLIPELVEFDGFVNYGQPINDLAGLVVAQNAIRLPVFTTRTVEQAEMEIQDGYTMVLGGLIREDISSVDEKIPFLGDLPFVGRAFSSKAEQAIKKNLLIFVSVRILRPDGQPLNSDAVALN